MLLEHFASYAAAAIRNASLFRQLVTHMGLGTLDDPVRAADELIRPPWVERLTVLSADMRSLTQLCNALDSPKRFSTCE